MRSDMGVRFLVIAAMAFLLTAGCARAQSFDLDKLKALDTYSAISEEEYKSKSRIYEETFEEDPALNYSLYLPDGWRVLGASEIVSDEAIDDIVDQANESGNKRAARLRERAIKEVKTTFQRNYEKGEMLGVITQYAGPQNLDTASKLVIEAVPLEHQMSAKNWLMNHLLTKGVNIIGVKQRDQHRAEALYVTLEGGFTIIVRIVAIRSGSRIILVSYSVAEQSWMDERQQQEMALRSFNLVNQSTDPAEIQRTFSFLDIVRFDYLTSWRLTAPEIFSTDGFDAVLINTNNDKALNGEIRLNIISTKVNTTLAKEIELVQEGLKKKGLSVGELIESPQGFKFKDHVKYSKIESYRIDDGKSKFVSYEYWLAVAVEDRYFYLITMLTPSRNADFYNWGRNIESFRFVAESIRP